MALTKVVQDLLNTASVGTTQLADSAVTSAKLAITPGTSGNVLTSDGSSWTSGSITVTITGEIRMYGGASAPSGWLLCNGDAISRTTYATLFGVIGTAFGTGDGSTTFNVPDMRGRSPIGSGTGSGLTARSLGSSGGSETHTLTGNQSARHLHATRTSSNPHGIDITSDTLSGYGYSPTDPPPLYTGVAPVYNDPPMTLGVLTSTFGDGQSHNIMQPFLTLNYIIKT